MKVGEIALRSRVGGIWRIGLGFALLAAIAACSGDRVTEPTSPLGACTSSVSISVSSGTAPTFTWTPACTVLGLIVEESGGGDLWFVWAEREGIAPGVRYGSVPAGSVQDDSPEALQAGATYSLALFRGTVGESPLTWSDAEYAQRVIGTRMFRP